MWAAASMTSSSCRACRAGAFVRRWRLNRGCRSRPQLPAVCSRAGGAGGWILAAQRSRRMRSTRAGPVCAAVIASYHPWGRHRLHPPHPFYPYHPWGGRRGDGTAAVRAASRGGAARAHALQDDPRRRVCHAGPPRQRAQGGRHSWRLLRGHARLISEPTAPIAEQP